MIDLDNLPVYEFLTLYYLFYKEKKEEEKMTDDQKASAAMGRLLEDHM